MRVLIIEDEIPASAALAESLRRVDPGINVVAILQTAQEVQERLPLFAGTVDLIFMDIQLQGTNLLGMTSLQVPAPVIFVTAFDAFFLEALHHSSLDYILKPINDEKIRHALEKYVRMKSHFSAGYETILQTLVQQKKQRRTRILLRKGSDYHFCRVEDVAYFYSELKLVFLTCFDGTKHLTDLRTLSNLEEEIDPAQFYRANRKFIVNINAIKKFRPHDRVKLLVELKVKVPENVIISQDNASAFKNWIASKNDLADSQ